MARGSSGRIVIEVEPEFKKRLYRALAMHDCTLKDWFLQNACRFCEETEQPDFPGMESISSSLPANGSTKKDFPA
jgi:hypothetical protein